MYCYCKINVGHSINTAGCVINKIALFHRDLATSTMNAVSDLRPHKHAVVSGDKDYSLTAITAKE